MSFLISDVILPETVDLDYGSFKSKDDLFRSMVSLLYKAGKITSEEKFLESLYEREAIGSTYMGNGIAIPHGKSEAVVGSGIAFCRCAEGGLYESYNENGIVNLIFMFAIPQQTSGDNYIKLLSTLARLLMHEDFIQKLYEAKDYKEVIKAIRATESVLEE
jgi:fructose-specific phosphotransferase system IIA component